MQGHNCGQLEEAKAAWEIDYDSVLIKMNVRKNLRKIKRM
jgi:hypothetical protein